MEEVKACQIGTSKCANVVFEGFCSFKDFSEAGHKVWLSGAFDDCLHGFLDYVKDQVTTFLSVGLAQGTTLVLSFLAILPADWSDSGEAIVTFWIADAFCIVTRVAFWDSSGSSIDCTLGAGQTAIWHVIWALILPIGLIAYDASVFIVLRASLPAQRARANVAFLAFRIAESLVEFLSWRTVAANMSGTTSVCILPASLGTILYLSKKVFDTFGAVDSSVLRVGLKLRGDNCFKSCCIFVVINEIVECVKFFVGFISELTKVNWPVHHDVHGLLCSSFAIHMFNGILESHSFALDHRSEAGLEFRGIGIANESLDERLNEF